MSRSASSTNSSANVTLFDDTISRLRKCLVLAGGEETSSQQDSAPATVEESRDTAMEICEDDDLPTKLQDIVTVNGVVPESLIRDPESLIRDPEPLIRDPESLIRDPESLIKDEGSERIRIVDYENEQQIADIMRLITKDLSEPYSIYTYRYFIHNWPNLCLLALDTTTNEYVGAIVCKLDVSRQNRRRGYIAMLAVDESARRLGIGTKLVRQVIANMQATGCDEVVLETEVTNLNAIRLYTNLGFIRDKRLFRYYLNGVDAFHLKLFFTPTMMNFDDLNMYTRDQEVSE